MKVLTKIWDWVDFSKYCVQEEHTVLGVMSGTSADGLDVANVKFKMINGEIEYEVLNTLSIDYTRDFQQNIIKAYSNSTSNVEYLTRLNVELAKYHAQMISKLNWKYDIVAYHGQTVYHLPTFGATFQIGEPDILSVALGKPVIYGFRTKDMALNGQGAPISAYFDAYFLLKNKETAVLNIGGISNITAIDPDGELIAFDTGPGNCLIDEICQIYFGERYDKDGGLSSKGVIENEVLKILFDKSKEYIKKKPPKTTGREFFNLYFIQELLNCTSRENLLRTVVKYTALLIHINISYYLPNVKKIIVVGGGAYNKTLLSDLVEFGYAVDVPSSLMIDFREAIAMAFLGELFLRGEAYSKVVTGSRRPSLLGKLSLPS
ncbi:MAG: anhydro-N-acetylmuramic acid kinase [Fervidobacterium sp.]|nr:anhydro-N-acetylmuramic acid kinase [Fervidobacterium sp.]